MDLWELMTSLVDKELIGVPLYNHTAITQTEITSQKKIDTETVSKR